MDGKRYVRVVLLAAGLLPGCGDVAFESDPCKYMVGSHTVHFETFQGSVWARNPCDEIPSIGSASLSIDILDKELRAMQTGVRIFSADSWSAARNSKNDAQGKELVQWPAKTYPTGVISLTHDFRQPGYFVGVVTLEDVKSGKKHVLRLPFRVAKAAETNWLAILLVAVVLAAAGYYYFMVYRKRPAAAPA